MLSLGLALAAGAANLPPKPANFVTDEAHVLRPDTVTQLENELREYQAATGHEILLYVAQTTGSEPLETYTVDAAENWKAGRKGKDDGAVLFVFMRDHRVRIEVGYGLEGRLPDARAKQIVDEKIVPALKAGDPDSAVAAGVSAILATVSPDSKVAQSPSVAASSSGSSDSDSSGFWVGLLFVVLLVVVTVLLTRGLAKSGARRSASGAFSSGWIFGPGFGWGGGGGGFGGGGFGGGGFSGGGGSFGGGGASGSW